jgi:hypothetical protein
MVDSLWSLLGASELQRKTTSEEQEKKGERGACPAKLLFSPVV